MLVIRVGVNAISLKLDVGNYSLQEDMLLCCFVTSHICATSSLWLSIGDLLGMSPVPPYTFLELIPHVHTLSSDLVMIKFMTTTCPPTLPSHLHALAPLTHSSTDLSIYPTPKFTYLFLRLSLFPLLVCLLFQVCRSSNPNNPL